MELAYSSKIGIDFVTILRTKPIPIMIVMGKPLVFRRFRHRDHETHRRTQSRDHAETCPESPGGRMLQVGNDMHPADELCSTGLAESVRLLGEEHHESMETVHLQGWFNICTPRESMTVDGAVRMRSRFVIVPLHAQLDRFTGAVADREI